MMILIAAPAARAATGAIAGTVTAAMQPGGQVAGTVTAEWPMFRGSPARTGSVSRGDPGPAQAEILWTYDPRVRKGRIRMHSSPAVVDGQVYIGALYELQSLTEGIVYCVNAAEGRQVMRRFGFVLPGEEAAP